MPKQALPSTQQFLEIDEIREGTTILKDKNLRAVLLCSSINFELKSPQEQDAVLYQYQNFLNSLDFSIQYLIHSRKLDIDGYLQNLDEIKKQQTNDLLKVQTEEYITFVREFVELQNIMSKSFYVVVPYDAITISKESVTGKLTGIFSTKKSEAPVSAISDEEFLRRKTQLWQRVNNVIAGLQTVGVKSIPLNDEELYELFHNVYNPGEKAPSLR